MGEDRALYTRVVLSGGETKGLAQLGALHYFCETGQLSQEGVTHYAGSSVGSLIALLLVCGYSPFTVWTEVYGIDSLFSPQPPQTWGSLAAGFGLMSVDGILGKVQELVEARFSPIPTLYELYARTGKVLVVTVTNLSLQQTEYCSYKLTPNMSCLEAVRCSCNIPALFQKIERNGSVYVDGSLLDNFPLRQIDDHKHSLLAILTVAPSDPTCNGFVDYLTKLLMLPLHAETRRSIDNASSNVRVVTIRTGSISPVDFSINREKRREMFCLGFSTAAEELAQVFLKFEDYRPWKAMPLHL